MAALMINLLTKMFNSCLCSGYREALCASVIQMLHAMCEDWCMGGGGRKLMLVGLMVS